MYFRVKRLNHTPGGARTSVCAKRACTTAHRRRLRVAARVESREFSACVKFCARNAMYAHVIRWLCFAAVYAAHVAAALQHRFTDECVLELIWPRPDAVVLVATDSKSIEIFFNLQGNCTEFLRPANSLPRLQLFMRHVGTDGQAEQQIYASPFSDSKPCFAAIFSSPLIFALVNSKEDRRGIRDDWLWDVNEKQNKEASIWTLAMMYITVDQYFRCHMASQHADRLR